MTYNDFGTAVSGTTASWTWTTSTGSGTSIQLTTPTSYETKPTTKSKKRQISPTIYFKFVKSKLSRPQKERVVQRMAKLKKLIPYAKSTEQHAFYEELSKELVLLLKESEIDAIGCGENVTKDQITKFMDLVTDKVVKFEPIENFPRVMPQKIRKKYMAIKKTNVFDSFHVLFVDLTKEKLKTTSQKIQNKDPILFGQSKVIPGKFFFIADWVDKYCDLTFDKFVDEMESDDDEFSVQDIEPLTEKNFGKIVTEVNERIRRLAETKSDNWREKVREEEKQKLEESMRKKWWEFWKGADA